MGILHYSFLTTSLGDFTGIFNSKYMDTNEAVKSQIEDTMSQYVLFYSYS